MKKLYISSNSLQLMLVNSNLFVALLGILVLNPTGQASLEDSAKKPIPKVQISEIVTTALKSTLTYPVKIESKVYANVMAEAEGVVGPTPQIGSLVKKGQTLLTISQSDPVYQFAPFKITAPVNGAISSIEITQGSQVSRGQKLLTIIDPKQIQLVAEITSHDLNQFKKGLTGNLRLNSNDTPIKVQVSGVSPTVNPITGTATCILEVEKSFSKTSPGLLSPGTLGQVTFEMSSKNGIYVPKTAIFYRGNDPFVRIVIAGKAQFRKVGLGADLGETIEILSGLKEHETIISRTTSFLPDGQVVDVEKK